MDDRFVQHCQFKFQALRFAFKVHLVTLRMLRYLESHTCLVPVQSASTVTFVNTKITQKNRKNQNPVDPQLSPKKVMLFSLVADGSAASTELPASNSSNPLLNGRQVLWAVETRSVSTSSCCFRLRLTVFRSMFQSHHFLLCNDGTVYKMWCDVCIFMYIILCM